MFNSLQGKQGSSRIFHADDGFTFYRYKTTETSVYYRCTKYNDGCPMRAVHRITGSLQFSGDHSHAPDRDEVPFRTARLSLMNEARQLDVASVQEVFNSSRTMDGPFADILTYHRMQPSLERARMQALPSCKDLTELVEALQNPAYSCITAVSDNEDTLYRGCTRTGNGSLVTLFLSKMCLPFLRILPSVFIFHTKVLICGQICTIGGRWDTHVLPLAWCILEVMSQETLDAAFILLRAALHPWQFGTVTCGVAEMARAFSSIFNVPVYPSLYDYINDIKVFLKESGTIKESPQVIKIAKLYCALPLLPKDLLQIGLNLVARDIQRFCSLEESMKLQELLTLVHRWLANPSFCVCGSSGRTDFGCEELKLKMMARFGNEDFDDFYCLTKFMVSTTRETVKDVEAAVQGLRRRTSPTRQPLSEESDMVVLLQQLRTSAFALEVHVHNIMHLAGEKISFLI